MTRRFALTLGMVLLATAARAQMFDDFALPGVTPAPGKVVAPWVIADFDAGKPALKDGTLFLRSSKGVSEVVATSEAKIRHEGKGQSMRVQYQIKNGEPAVLSADLKGADASKRHALTFFVFAAREGSPAEIEIKVETAAGGGHARVKGISPYFWARQVLTFEALGIKDATAMKSISITIPAEAKPASGAFFIDQMAFE